MKRYILVAGIGFYIITFLAIFYLTWANFDESHPENAKVINFNTRETVWQPSSAGFNKFVRTRDAALQDPSHAADLLGEDGALSASGVAVQAYGEYQKSLYVDDGKYSPADIVDADEHYTEAVCFHCHSQFVRPLRSENHRWGPTSQIGEGAHDSPTRYGTRRVGPDLQRVGLLRSDDWHFAHFDNPKNTAPQSIMAPYGGISRYWFQVPQSELDTEQVSVDQAALDFYNMHRDTADHKATSPDERAKLAFEWVAGLNLADDTNDMWHLYKGHVDGFANDSPLVVRVAKKPKKRIRDLVAYLQTRGIGIGITGVTNTKMGQDAENVNPESKTWQRYARKLEFAAGIWRLQNPAPRPSSRPNYVLAPAEMEDLRPTVGDFVYDKQNFDHNLYVATRESWDKSVKAGMQIFMAKCAGCHGGLDDSGSPLDVRMGDMDSLLRVGNGYGPAAEWLIPEPRNFHLASFSMSSFDAEGYPHSVSLNSEGNPRSPRERGSEAIKFRNRSGDPDINLATPEDLFHTIRNGMPPSAMPAWPYLTDLEVWDLVNVIMYFGDARPAALQVLQAYETEFGALSVPAREKAIKDLVRQNTALGVFEDNPSWRGPGYFTKNLSYYNLSTVRAAFDGGVTVPLLPRKTASQDSEVEKKAFEVWSVALGDSFNKDSETWSSAELVKIGAQIFSATVPEGARTAECWTCHGKDGDGWGKERGRMLQNTGFAARNYYAGTFKLGSTRADIWRAMRYGIAGTPMNAQTKGWSALETHALAEFVLDKTRQGVFGIEPLE